ncbi:S-layer homology domain-containing protein [Cohnella cholangitidis]|uniref:S-layer homology domain-containing protein n=1 Tax=Cohnella cholangitidis TaxID=2598458 RepID=A0A7G5C4E7_9BACL|nr:S-layer homology domain-containing protein [Cohnella cholangitidis]QMV44081.1 S-layer homology domain-containing protein [Cohnella cholangitidis]
MAFEATLISAGDAAALGQKIGEANQALADHPAGTGVGQTLIGDFNALQASIAAAQQIFNQAANYTDTQLAEAIADLNAALASFEAAIIPAGNPAALAALLSDARQALADHPEGAGVGEASGSARSALQSAIDDAQAIVDAAANQTGDRLSDAVVALTKAMARFEAAWVGLVLTAPANGLYGAGDTLRFTVFYGYEVTVTGMPVLPLRVGADSVTQTVYAPYTGALGTAITELTFEYKVPAGLADTDGLEAANALELPAGAGIDRVSGGAAPLAYVAPATGGIRIVAIPPEITLSTSPNGSSRQVVSVTANVYGEASGNMLTALRWLPGNVSTAEFAGGTSGTDLMAASQFTVTVNGDYTVYAQDGAGNETAKSVIVNGISSGNPGPSAPIVPDRPPTSRTTVTVQPAGGIIVRVDSSDIERTSRPDGTAIERIQLSERIREQVLEALKSMKNTTIEIIVDDREAAVQTKFPAAWIAEIAKAYPNSVVETKLNDSSYRLPVSLLDLAALAKRLGTDVSAMTVSIVQERSGQDIRREIERIGVSQGFAVQSDVIDFKVTLEANGQTLEVREFGGMYVARSIQLAGGTADRNLVAVYYDRANSQVSFVPTRLLAGPNGTTEAALNVPHNSFFTVVDVKARQFADLQGHWAKTDAELLASKLLVNGVTADRFAPASTLTRAEFSAMLVRGLGLTAKEGEDGVRFADVSASAWYAPMVKAAVEGGLVSGVSSDRFAPNDPITREQMAVMIDGALTLAGYTGQATEPTSGYADREAIASWAQASVARASEAGILQGTADGRFVPKAYATRAEAAVMLKRFLYAIHFID